MIFFFYHSGSQKANEKTHTDVLLRGQKDVARGFNWPKLIIIHDTLIKIHFQALLF